VDLTRRGMNGNNPERYGKDSKKFGEIFGRFQIDEHDGVFSCAFASIHLHDESCLSKCKFDGV
jgi:hypothetical protein